MIRALTSMALVLAFAAVVAAYRSMALLAIYRLCVEPATGVHLTMLEPFAVVLAFEVLRMKPAETAERAETAEIAGTSKAWVFAESFVSLFGAVGVCVVMAYLASIVYG